MPRLGVAELPLPGGARQLAGRAGPAQLALALAAGHLLGDVAQQRLAELAHRLRGEPEVAVGAAAQGAAVAQRLLELLEGARVDRGLVAELAGELVEVEVVHPGAAVGLRELLGEVVEVGEVLEDAGAVAETEALLAVHPLRAAPVLAGAQRLEVGVEPGQGLHQRRRAERLLRELHQLRRAARRVIEFSIRCAAAARWAIASRSSSMFCGFSGKKSPCLAMNSSKSSCGVLAALVLLEQLVEVARASR